MPRLTSRCSIIHIRTVRSIKILPGARLDATTYHLTGYIKICYG